MAAVIDAVAHDDTSHAPVLSTVDRVCELCFGLFMALTFVGAVSAATAGANPGRTMFYTALGCNLAWRWLPWCTPGATPPPACCSCAANSAA